MDTLKEVMTFAEATEFLGKNANYLADMGRAGKLIEGTHYRTAGRVKLILKSVVDKIKEGYKMLTAEEREGIMNECVEIETTEGCHDDQIEDYNSPLEFYLSNVEQDSYIEYLKDKYSINDEDAISLQDDIIKAIKAK